VVRDGVIVGEGANAVLALRDPTAHAEMIAIREAAARLGTHSLEGCTLYASSEPCPMCLGASYWARVDAVVYASGRAEAARAGFDDARFYEELALPPAARRVPMRQVAVEGALALLEEWREKPDKVQY
jgi:tRNA(Arg) A34 adenosine deaminase TadA